MTRLRFQLSGRALLTIYKTWCDWGAGRSTSEKRSASCQSRTWIQALQISKPSCHCDCLLSHPDAAQYRHCFFFKIIIYERLSAAQKHSQNLVGGGGGVLPIMWHTYQNVRLNLLFSKLVQAVTLWANH